MDGRTNSATGPAGPETPMADGGQDLSGVLSAREFLQVADDEVRRASRYSRPLSAAVILIDNLALILEAEGPEITRAIARGALARIHAVLRGPDQVARLGPGEFGVLMPETRLEQGYIAAQRLRSSFAERAIETPAGPRDVSLCIGLATLSPRIRNPKTFLMKACVELRRARAQGPGTVCAAAPDTTRLIRPATRAIH